jgi:hypothetical protein
MRWRGAVVLGVALFLAGCGSAPEKPARAPAAARAQPKQSAKVEAPPKAKIPKKCGKKKGECLPPSRWVKRLCDDVYPDVALHMFRPGTPWKRLYMLARAEAFNASGGASLIGEKLEPGEEVIAVRRRKNDGQFQMGNTEGYDVLRWNGACATIHDGDFTTEEPTAVKNSKIEWRTLGLDLRLVLEKQPEIAEAYEARRKSCKGINMGRVSDTCEVDDKRLVDEIVRYVRDGKKLPKPVKAP